MSHRPGFRPNGFFFFCALASSCVDVPVPLFPTPTPTPSFSTEAPTAALSLAFTSRISGESPTLRSKSSTDISRPVCRSFTVDAEPRAGLTPAPGEFVGLVCALALSMRSAAASSTRNSWPVSRSLMRNTFSISNGFGVVGPPSVGDGDAGGASSSVGVVPVGSRSAAGEARESTSSSGGGPAEERLEG